MAGFSCGLMNLSDRKHYVKLDDVISEAFPWSTERHSIRKVLCPVLVSLTKMNMQSEGHISSFADDIFIFYKGTLIILK